MDGYIKEVISCQERTRQAHRQAPEAHATVKAQVRDVRPDVEQAQSLVARRGNAKGKYAFWVLYMKVVG